MSLPSRYMEVDPDVELCFDDKVVPGHSQLLSFSSKVLKEAIKAGSSQGASISVTKETQLMSIPMKGTSSSDWLKVVPFIYLRDDGMVAAVTWDNVEALLVLGDKYDMPGVACRASKFLNKNQKEMNSNEKDPNYIWKWILLLDHMATAGNKPVFESCIQKVALRFKETCTMDNMKVLSKEGVEMLAGTLAGTVLPRGCPFCGHPSLLVYRTPEPANRFRCESCLSYFG
jgi:hypothetical protein